MEKKPNIEHRTSNIEWGRAIVRGVERRAREQAVGFWTVGDGTTAWSMERRG